MAYTVKQLLESKQFPDMRLVTCKENLNQEIKGIRIIEIEDMERYLTGGELLLTNMKVYFGETDREFRKHLNELEKKQVSGFIIKQHPDMVQKVNYYDILLKFCSERNIPVIEISEDEYYWGIIKYVILQIYDENIARLIYFKLTHDNISNVLLDGENFEDPTKNILFLLSSMIGNPVALYYSNLTCCASTTQDLSDFVFEKNVEKYKPNIITRFEYQKQTKEHTQYITTINVLGRAEVYLVVTEMNMPLTVLDYMALENAVITLQWDPDQGKLVPMKDNDTVNMDPVGEALAVTSKKRQVRIFFAKPKPGYRFAGVGVDSAQTSGGVGTDGGKSRAVVDDLNNMNATSLGRPREFQVYDDIWKDAKDAASSAGYEKFLAFAGEKTTLNIDWELYWKKWKVRTTITVFIESWRRHWIRSKRIQTG